ncbi:MAG: CTP synthase [Candidatus Kuenenia stuttgartiensis]|jgi:CTP synthase|uniref:CTP synthase n=1 Tax=Kuenenia stuttgartiensis TaxID=174633 RepID=A0A2C9CER3_KUEST|nr:CTP synthase [Candidatus Kuenenia stuttgartiensis]MBE7546601.1 CTP synthase [Planctomycetia bacterium]MBW7941973.1 CTP synthase [Candidatus Kuenenia stuttgartiensis]MBZ0191292.1 CTP synthase [Candidatus Kuenenia stuttgartiensis]MCF6151256.1 CTP synthase [Candidatus Kuenenia stuttgartiensis]MCL4726003.1 CTP synthase [Candidatus Kuenenia stuttgartiensis]
MTKHIFVTGGVVSSLGKGLNSASIGMLLESRGLKVRLQKFDPYVNVDPGTMSPYEHGEVYVTEDGAETDLDLGHYERFTNAETNKYCNFTTGSIYYSVIMKERNGEYLGKTVQVIPHITNEVIECIKKLDGPDTDVVISEIGGIVGDIESQLFLEAIRQFGQTIGRGNVLYIHLTLVPYLSAADEIKTKPTQHSVGMLRQAGVQPDIIICRTEKHLSEEIKEKISLFCNVDKNAIIEEKDVKPYLYEIPLILMEQGLDKLIIQKLQLKTNNGNIDKWLSILEILRNPKYTTEIAIVGKYIGHQSAYESIYESLIHGGIENNARVKERRIESEDVERFGAEACLKGVNGILAPGGFGARGVEGKVMAIQYARENNIPFFGICLGMQCASIEFARNVCNLADANSTEFDPATPHPVISLLEEQQNITKKGGTMRLGAQACFVEEGTKAYEAYKKAMVSERHRHRYEFNDAYKERFLANGMRFSGHSQEDRLVEIMEIINHPWFVCVQFHPEFKSKPTKAHPLFREFIRATLKK